MTDLSFKEWPDQPVAGTAVDKINDTVNQWKSFANEVNVESTLREAIGKTLLNLRK